ncbi:MAG: hypothetical protein ACJ8FS_16480 [Sphingomicrobium sp.]
MNALVAFAKEELALLRGNEPDEMQDLIDANVIKIVTAFSEGGHSGTTADYTLGIIERLLRFDPLTPITGEDAEWMNVSEASGQPMWQNRRCSHVFKDETKAWDIDAADPSAPIAFPYRPPNGS